MNHPLQPLANRLGGRAVTSDKGSPYVSVKCGSVRFSIIQFPTTNQYRVFFPIPAEKGKQTKLTFKTEEGLVNFFKDKGLAVRS